MANSCPVSWCSKAQAARPARAQSRLISKFLPAGGALAIHGGSPCSRRLMPRRWRSATTCLPGWPRRSRPSPPAGSTTVAARSCSMRSRSSSYYPTRTETAIFHAIMPEVAARVPKGAVVVEFGAGSQTKTPILLEAIAPAAYVPVDISGDYLEHSAAELQQRFPKIEVIPVVADFRGRSRCRAASSICRGSASSPARPSAISCRGARPTSCVSSARCSRRALSC